MKYKALILLVLLLIRSTYGGALLTETQSVNLLDEEVTERFLTENCLTLTDMRKNVCLKRSFGALSSALSSAVFFPVGVEGALHIWDNVVFDNTIAALSLIPIEAVGMKFIGDLFSSIFNEISENERKVIKRKNYLLSGLKIITVGGLSVLSSAPYVYLSYIKFFPHLNQLALIFAIPSAYVKTTVDYWCMSGILKKSLNLFRVQDTGRSFLKKELSNSLMALYSLSDEEVLEAERIMCDESVFLEERVKALFALHRIFDRPTTRATPYAQQYFGGLGGLIGAIGMAVMEPLSEASIRSIGLTNEGVIKSAAIAATVAAASLMALSTWESFEGFYPFITTCRSRFSFYSLFIIIISLLATLPNAALSMEYLGYDSFFGIFALICNVMGTFSLDYWAIDHLIRELKGGTTKRERIAQKIIYLRDTVDELNDTSVRFIYNLCHSS
jgi:hypothetical protein